MNTEMCGYTVRVRGGALTHAYPHDAGYDLRARERGELLYGGRAVVGTGVYLELPPGLAALVLPRSGLSSQGVLVSVGLIDSGYRGEIKILLSYFGQEDSFIWAVGSKLAQLIFLPIPDVKLESAEELTGSVRASRGLGSSGL